MLPSRRSAGRSVRSFPLYTATHLVPADRNERQTRIRTHEAPEGWGRHRHRADQDHGGHVHGRRVLLLRHRMGVRGERGRDQGGSGRKVSPRLLQARHQERRVDRMRDARGRREAAGDLPREDRGRILRQLPTAQSGGIPHQGVRRLRHVGFREGPEGPRSDQALRVLDPRHRRRARGDPRRPPGCGVRAAADQLRRLGEPVHPIPQMLRGRPRQGTPGHRHGARQGRDARQPPGCRQGRPGRCRAGILAFIVGPQIRRRPRRCGHRPLRDEQHRSDGGEHPHPEGIREDVRLRKEDDGEGRGSAGIDRHHPVHLLRVLRQGVPQGHRDIRILRGDELADALRQQGHGRASARMAGRRAREAPRLGMHQMREVREGLPPAHPHRRRIGEGRRDLPIPTI